MWISIKCAQGIEWTAYWDALKPRVSAKSRRGNYFIKKAQTYFNFWFDSIWREVVRICMHKSDPGCGAPRKPTCRTALSNCKRVLHTGPLLGVTPSTEQPDLGEAGTCLSRQPATQGESWGADALCREILTAQLARGVWSAFAAHRCTESKRAKERSRENKGATRRGFEDIGGRYHGLRHLNQ
jgi:hypothetical protein